MCCTDTGFKTLTDLAIQFRAASERCVIRLEQAQGDLAGEQKLRQSCEAALAAVPPPEPFRSPMVPLVGYAAGVLGTVLSALAVSIVPDGGRAAVAGVGATMILGGAFLVLP